MVRRTAGCDFNERITLTINDDGVTANRRSNPASMSEASSHAPHRRADRGVAIRHRGCATFPDFVLVQVYVAFAQVSRRHSPSCSNSTYEAWSLLPRSTTVPIEYQPYPWVSLGHSNASFGRYSMESRLVFGAPPRSGKFGRQGADGWLFLELCRRCGAYDLSAMRLINAGFIANADFT